MPQAFTHHVQSLTLSLEGLGGVWSSHRPPHAAAAHGHLLPHHLCLIHCVLPEDQPEGAVQAEQQQNVVRQRGEVGHIQGGQVHTPLLHAKSRSEDAGAMSLNRM